MSQATELIKVGLLIRQFERRKIGGNEESFSGKACFYIISQLKSSPFKRACRHVLGRYPNLICMTIKMRIELLGQNSYSYIIPEAPLESENPDAPSFGSNFMMEVCFSPIQTR